MDYLREGIHLRGMAQKDPLVEYKVEGHAMFQEMQAAVKEEVVTLLFHAEIVAEPQTLEPQAARNGGLAYEHSQASALDGSAAAATATGTYTEARPGGASTSTPVVQQHRTDAPVGRNDPCPCGSGLKYKRCHGKAA
jgi:preprotein translocase subunit SecA